jgi:lipopolysaccharide transport system ATP-binding protein
MSAAIRISKLSKVYKHYWGPRSLLKEVLFRIPSHHEMWALRNITLDIEPGESFGIVGDNGAGKSTLLKILAGTAFPTQGATAVQGKVSALLELGAGFHPEFSGRENIYFNGALMGMSREEIKEREKEIVEFAELEEFIDKPVKTYSSGMYVRLGFAVATGFDPDILIVDEALAVGDQRFQKKCTDRIMSFKRNGKTILFCSHNLYQVKALCDRALWLSRGCVEGLGPAGTVVDGYSNFLREERRNGTAASGAGGAKESQVCWIDKVCLRNGESAQEHQFQTGGCLELDIWACFRSEFQGTPGIGVSLLRNDGMMLYTTATTMDKVPLREISPNYYHSRIVFPEVPLMSGLYYFNISATDQDNMQVYDVMERAEPFSISYPGPDFGLVKLHHYWLEER